MAKLIVSLEGNFLREYPLDKERISIGRRPANDIHIDNLAMSGLHASLLTIGNDSFLEDLGSTNGTMVNGKSIKKHLLQHDDVIEFGKYHITYLNEKLANKTALGGRSQDFEKTMMIRPAVTNSASISATNASPTPSVSDVPTSVFKAPPDVVAQLPAAHLQVLNGSSIGRELVLNKALTTLGKAGVQVAVITRRPHGYFITHVEGKVLPLVNGQSIGVQAHQLSGHDIIELAGVKMEFYIG